ncbi:MAG TPA: TIGR02587 family membrane protein [Kouleothrix sp.]|nr:TIGR02587 family membrane protein [Kouleothrix sp.]
MQSTIAQSQLQAGTNQSHRSVVQSLQEYGRGIAGGLLFSLPLLYTMEMWQAGITMHPVRQALGLAATAMLLLGYNRYAGLRHDASWLEVAIDSIEELGLGIVLATLILALLGRIAPGMPLGEVLGKITVEAMTMAIGVSIGTAQLGSSGDSGGAQAGAGEQADSGDSGMAGDTPTFASQIVLGFCGAMVIASNVAPTEEIIVLAVELHPWYIVALGLLSILLGALVLFFSDFYGSAQLTRHDGGLSIIAAAMVNYAVALAAAAVALWFFDSFDGFALVTCIAEVVVLGVAATLGASAGRLLLQASAGEKGAE